MSRKSQRSNETAISSIHNFSQRLKKVAITSATRIAEKAAPLLTEEGRRTFDIRQAPSGMPWPPGKKPEDGDLVQSGKLRKWIVYRAYGRTVKVALGVPYAKYQIGKRPVYPKRHVTLPDRYQAILLTLFRTTIDREFKP